MRPRTVATMLVGVCSAAIVIACGGTKSDPPVDGSEGGACLPNATCNAGLVCTSNVCAKVGSGGSGGSSGTAGTGASGPGGKDGGVGGKDGGIGGKDGGTVAGGGSAGCQVLWQNFDLYYEWTGEHEDAVCDGSKGDYACMIGSLNGPKGPAAKTYEAYALEPVTALSAGGPVQVKGGLVFTEKEGFQPGIYSWWVHSDEYDCEGSPVPARYVVGSTLSRTGEKTVTCDGPGWVSVTFNPPPPVALKCISMH